MGGIDTKKVIKTACKTKTPPLRCHSPALPNTCLKAEPPTSIACSPGANCGIPKTAKSKHKNTKRLITQNSPDRPNCSTTRAENTQDKAKLQEPPNGQKQTQQSQKADHPKRPRQAELLDHQG